MGIVTRFKNGWNAFMNNDPLTVPGISYSYRPDRPRLTGGNEKSIVSPIYNRIALDVAELEIAHVRLDKEGRFDGYMDSYLNYCLTESANIDQTHREFIHDVVLSTMDEGSVAIVPVETINNPNLTEGFDICSVRTGKILEWFPTSIRVRVYNDRTGHKEDIVVPKSITPIIENPFYTVMNDNNSIVQRLIRKLNLLDSIDEQSGKGKLDIIIQLPYGLKSSLRKKQAEERIESIKEQLRNSEYGIAYTDATEKITQLNRPAENNLMSQIEYLTNMLYDQLGITPEVLNGTADEKTMLNYYTRTVEPYIAAIVNEIKRKWISKTGKTQGQSIRFRRNVFKLVPVSELGNVADSLTRNEILSTNEVRDIISYKPSKQDGADDLRNKNLNPPSNNQSEETNEEEIQNGNE